MRLVTSFPNRAEYEKALRVLRAARLPYELLSPEPGYRLVGFPGLVIDEDIRFRLAASSAESWTRAGLVEFQPTPWMVPSTPPPLFAEDVLGRTALMVLQPCLADATKIRAIVHVTGNLAPVLPYMNAVMPDASYNVKGPVLTFRDGYRMVTLEPWRIAVAKVDDLIDLWRVLEAIRVRVNTCWRDRPSITPCFTLRQRPPALQIYLRLPRTNCRVCGEQTCFAFAFKVWSGMTTLSRCTPVVSGDFRHLGPALEELCGGGVTSPPVTADSSNSTHEQARGSHGP